MAGWREPSDAELLALVEDQEEDQEDSQKPERSCRPLPGPGGVAQEVVEKKRAETPLEASRLRYLWVTHLAAQVWCEQQMVYQREQPELGSPENAALLDLGKSIHLARELEDHDLVPICATSQEDSWAIKLLNLLLMIPALQAGQRVREFPVFGVLEGVFVVGVIDQLGYTPKGELQLNELKTRKEASMPSRAQKKKDGFQVSLYKCLFDAMVRGCLGPESFVRHLQLRPEQPLGPQVREQALRAGFTACRFQDLVELAFLNLTFSDLPPIDRLQVEYVHQETNASLGTEVVAYEEETVKAEGRYFLAYWKGQRDPKGVEVEEAWKCRHCAYSEVCRWRMARAGSPTARIRQKTTRGKQA
ncbi:exonuclease V isoform X1 [Pogona vitticeps]